MQNDSGMPITELRVDGGAAGNDLLMQFQADLLEIPVARPAITETTSLGAAYLAGLAVGFWKDMNEIKSHWKVEKKFHPRTPGREMAEMKSRWQDALQRAKAWDRPAHKPKTGTESK
jgi:glycerol kinase